MEAADVGILTPQSESTPANSIPLAAGMSDTQIPASSSLGDSSGEGTVQVSVVPPAPIRRRAVAFSKMPHSGPVSLPSPPESPRAELRAHNLVPKTFNSPTFCDVCSGAPTLCSLPLLCLRWCVCSLEFLLSFRLFLFLFCSSFLSFGFPLFVGFIWGVIKQGFYCAGSDSLSFSSISFFRF